MTSFRKGDFANAPAKDGREVRVRIVGQQDNGRYVVQVYDEDGRVQETTQQVEPSSLLPLRGPFFEVRGLVLTISAGHSSEVGEIVKTATSKSGMAFYCVRFADGTSEWLNEDQVFIEDELLPARATRRAESGS